MPIKILKEKLLIAEQDNSNIIKIRRINEKSNIQFGIVTYHQNTYSTIEVCGKSLKSVRKILRDTIEGYKEINLDKYRQILGINSDKSFNFYGKVLVKPKLEMPTTIHRIYLYNNKNKTVKELSLITNEVNIELTEDLLEVVTNLASTEFRVLEEPLVIKNVDSQVFPRIIIEDQYFCEKSIEATQLVIDVAINNGEEIVQRFIMPISEFFDWNSKTKKIIIKSEIGDTELYLPENKKDLKRVINLVEFEGTDNLDVLVIFDEGREFIVKASEIKSLIISQLF